MQYPPFAFLKHLTVVVTNLLGSGLLFYHVSVAVVNLLGSQFQ